jgi:predicted amidophosphoribosyltransferase
MGAGTAILDLLLPPRCVACGTAGHLLCAGCRSELVLLRGTVCARCGCPTAWPVERCGECAGRRISFASARAAVAYDGPARALVGAWKERGVRRLAEPAADIVVDVAPRPPASVLVPVPGEADRVGWRGVDSAQELARALGRRWELPVEDLLRRTRGARRQRGLSRAERRANVRHAFRAVAQAPARVALVDDV